MPITELSNNKVQSFTFENKTKIPENILRGLLAASFNQ